jgi:hypothetical protein
MFGWLARLFGRAAPVATGESSSPGASERASPIPESTPATAPPLVENKEPLAASMTRDEPGPVLDAILIDPPTEPAPTAPEPRLVDGVIVEPSARPQTPGLVRLRRPLPVLPSSRKQYFAPAYGQLSQSVQVLTSPEQALRAARPAPVPSRFGSHVTVPVLVPAGSTRTAVETPLSMFATTDTAPAADPAVLAGVDVALFTTFLLTPEGEDREATAAYLGLPTLAPKASGLRDEVIRLWQMGQTPLTPTALFDRAMTLTPHAGTALLLCHNVTRAFARGGQTVRWRKTDRLRGDYTDGAYRYSVQVPSSPGGLQTLPVRPSLFYFLFSPGALTNRDPGLWCRYFAAASVAWFAARKLAFAGAATPGAMVTAVASAAREVAAANGPRSPGWLWANTLFYYDCLRHARSAGQIRDHSAAWHAGASYGLSLAGVSPEPAAAWSAPPPAEPAVAIQRSTIDAVVETNSAHVRAGPSGCRYSLAITVEEGAAIRFGYGDWNDGRLTAVLPLWLTDLGYKFVEFAAGRQVMVRCNVPLEGRPACEVDAGDGWRAAAVAED